MLSQKIWGTKEHGTSNFCKRSLIQRISVEQEARDLYLASVDDLATMFCFFEHHKIALPPR